MILNSFSKDDTIKIGFEVAKRFFERCKVFALYGGLGAGKTVFAKGFAQALGIDPQRVVSPTFSIMNEYQGEVALYHFDMYRINGYEGFVSTNFFDVVGEGVILVEWSENIKEFLPRSVIHINIVVKKSGVRSIIIEGSF